MERINCEEERIQFLGKTQQEGFLIILNQDVKIQAYSDNITQHFPKLSTQIRLGVSLWDLSWESALDQTILSDHISEVNRHEESKKTTILLDLIPQPYYLSISKSNHLIYLEFERTVNLDPGKTKFINNRLIALQQEEQDVWPVLSSILSEHMQVDRVMVYQFNEDGSGVVVAESLLHKGLDSYLGLNYPEFDIPKQARALYKKVHCRFIVDVSEEGSSLIANDPEDINLQDVAIRRLAPIHLQYLKNAGFKSSISFSIILKGELWGLVCCQHENPIHVDLGIRNFCLMATHFAANKFQQFEDQERFKYQQEVQKLEMLLKEKVLLKSNFFSELKSYASNLINLLETDGLALIYEDSIYLEGVHPEKENLRSQIKQLLNLSNEEVFHSYSLKQYPDLQESLGNEIAGIAFAAIDRKKDFYLIWFRKELVIEKEWAGNPEKLKEEIEIQGKLHPSPRNSFSAWREDVLGTSKKWSKKEIHFIHRIREHLREALINKAGEIENLNKQLMEMNNALDTYAYTISHDLKNPLTAIKLSAEFLQYREDVKPEILKKMNANILDSVHIILNMLDKIHQYSKASSYNFEKELLEPESFVHDIVEINKQRYGSPNVEVIIHELLPVLGEKTLLYQLFLNLIGNAIKYSSKAVASRVEIQSYNSDNGIIYTIKDNGIGIAEDELESIYEMFKRMSNSSGYEGSGIGMSIVKRITDKLGIDISIKSQINKGTTIRLMFPNHIL